LPATDIARGIKVAFRLVEVLREAGFEAVVATADAKPPDWFQIPCSMMQAARLDAADGTEAAIQREDAARRNPRREEAEETRGRRKCDHYVTISGA